jgi:hypothetical protein
MQSSKKTLLSGVRLVGAKKGSGTAPLPERGH